MGDALDQATLNGVIRSQRARDRWIAREMEYDYFAVVIQNDFVQYFRRVKEHQTGQVIVLRRCHLLFSWENTAPVVLTYAQHTFGVFLCPPVSPGALTPDLSKLGTQKRSRHEIRRWIGAQIGNRIRANLDIEWIRQGEPEVGKPEDDLWLTWRGGFWGATPGLGEPHFHTAWTMEDQRGFE